MVKENPFDGELSECADLQEIFNKLCKVATNDAISVYLGLKKIVTLELEKKNLLNLLDANELVNKVKAENMMLFYKIKNLKLELSVAKEQTNRFVLYFWMLILCRNRTCVFVLLIFVLFCFS